MRFGRGLKSEFEDVDVLLKHPQSGNVEIVATGVRMLIQPKPTTPQDIALTGVQPNRPRWGAILETPRDDFRERNNIIRRADGSELVVRRVLSSTGYQELELEGAGSL